ncbi:MAG TPA: DNA repair protein RecO [bacterium]|jgi:DNA repair protein RecO (recombination protein O)|nr:DNA repair protein RecO [bacterium]
MNGVFTSEALLLRSTDRGDDDRVVFLLTPAHGRVAALAKHARGSRRRFGAALQAFCLFEAALLPRDGGFFYLNSAAAREFPLGPEPGFDAMAAAWLFLELADALATAGTAHPAFFELVLGGLRRLGRSTEGAEAVRLSVLWGSLEMAGWAPDLERCAACGKAGPWPDCSLDAARGGLLCPECRAPGAQILDAAVLTLWKDLAQGLPLGPCPPAAEAGLLRWIEYHTGRALRSASLNGLVLP